MICPHCSTVVKFDWLISDIMEVDEKKKEAIEVFYSECPNCDKVVVGVQQGKIENSHLGRSVNENTNWQKIVYPKTSDFSNSEYIPEQYFEDYEEAIMVISASPKAAAALCRRLLQSILRDSFKIKENSLLKEIEKFCLLSGIPSHILNAVDAVRIIGNIAAHPAKDKNTGEIVPVEPGEAEWLIEVIEALFDFVFVQPIKLEKRKKELNIKLDKIGKPKMK